MKLDASGAVQWSNVYYGTNWLSGPAGSSPYPIFQTADGGFVLSGTVQARTYPFENLFFLLKLDAHGNIVWQRGYGGVNGTYDHTSEQGGQPPHLTEATCLPGRAMCSSRPATAGS